MSIVEALWRYHLNPFLTEAADAVRRKPWLFVVVALMLGVIVLRPGAARLEVPLPPEPWVRALAGLLVSAFVVASLSDQVAALGRVRRGFYLVRPGGPAAWRWYVLARLTVSWALVSVVVGLLTSAGNVWWLTGWIGGGAAALAGAAVLSPRWLRLLPRTPQASARWGRGIVALWASAPGRFVLPWVAAAAVLVWARAGGAGFVWAEHPPVAALLTDLTLPALAALLGAEAPPSVPYRFAWLARAPWRRVALSAVGPGAALTVVYLLLAVSGTASAGDAVRAVAMNLAGAALWVFWGLRVGTGSLFTLAVSWGWLTVGLVADAEFWALWAGVSALAALALAFSWVGQVTDGTRAREEARV